MAGFVAVKGGEVVGFIIGEIKGLGFGLEKSGWIVVIGVDHRNMGDRIGQALAKRLFQYVRKRAIQDIYPAM